MDELFMAELPHFGVAAFVIAMAYLGALIAAGNHLRRASRFMSRWQTQWVLYWGIVAHLAVRSLSWAVVCWSLLTGQDGWGIIVIVLTSIPEFIFLSVFLLLLMHWVEVYIFSRIQFVYSTRSSFHKAWRGALAVTHALFYSGVAVFFVFFFLREPTQYAGTWDTGLYLTEACSNLVLPVTHVSLWVYNAWRFSGFAFRSAQTKKNVRMMNKVVCIWSLGRLLNGALLIASSQVQNPSAAVQAMYPIAVVSVLLFAEFLPIIFTLDWKVTIAITFGEEGARLVRKPCGPEAVVAYSSMEDISGVARETSGVG